MIPAAPAASSKSETVHMSPEGILHSRLAMLCWWKKLTPTFSQTCNPYPFPMGKVVVVVIYLVFQIMGVGQSIHVYPILIFVWLKVSNIRCTCASACPRGWPLRLPGRMQNAIFPRGGVILWDKVPWSDNSRNPVIPPHRNCWLFCPASSPDSCEVLLAFSLSVPVLNVSLWLPWQDDHQCYKFPHTTSLILTQSLEFPPTGAKNQSHALLFLRYPLGQADVPFPPAFYWTLTFSQISSFTWSEINKLRQLKQVWRNPHFPFLFSYN